MADLETLAKRLRAHAATWRKIDKTLDEPLHYITMTHKNTITLADLLDEAAKFVEERYP